MGIHAVNAQYCVPNFPTGCDDDDMVNSFTLTGENGTDITNINTGCSTGAYDDRTAITTVDLLSGTTYDASITTGYYDSDPFFGDDGDFCAIWIDFNDNQIFEVSERVATYNQYLSITTGSLVPVVIPVNAALGAHRMRVMVGYHVDENWDEITAADFDPCNMATVLEYGEVHDYTVNIITACTDPIVNLGNDTTICAGTTLTLDANNAGLTFLWSDTSTSQTLDVSTSGTFSVTVIDGTCSTSDTIEVSIAPLPSADTITVTTTLDAECTITFNAANEQDVISYDWDFGDGSTHSDINSPTHTYIPTGPYNVVLIITNDCGSDTLYTTVNCSNVGIGNVDLKDAQLKLYPNPAKDYITIEHENNVRMEEVTVLNILGQVVFQGSTKNANKYQINTSALASGVYTLRIKSNQGFIVRKFEVLK